MMPDRTSLTETSPRYHGWRVVVVCFAMALFCWGFGFYGHGVYLAELQRLHGWPASLIAGASTAYYLCSAAVVAFAGDAIERLGPRNFILLGIGCMALSTALLPMITSPWQLYLDYFVMAFGWGALSLASITNLIGLWFRERRGLAISLALNGASFGGIVIAPLLVFLSAHSSFATAMWVATGLMLALLLPLALIWLKPPPAARAVVPATGVAQAGAPVAARWSKARALRDFGFWTVTGPFALALTAQVGFIVHQVAFLSPLIGRSGTGWAIAITTTMAVVGRVGVGAIIDRLDQRLMSALSFASQAAALVVMTRTENAAVLYGACAVFGFSVGNLITFPALIIQREFAAASFGTLISLTMAVCQICYAFGPGLLGVVRDATGGYAAALLVCVALDVTAAAIILVRPRRIA